MTTTVSLVEELNLVRTMADPYAPWFTGWRSCDPESVRTEKVPDPSFGYVGQMIQFFRSDPGLVAYVNLPGMQSGCNREGDLFDIGTERLYVNPPTEEMRELLVAGLAKLRATIEEYEKGNSCQTA